MYARLRPFALRATLVLLLWPAFASAAVTCTVSVGDLSFGDYDPLRAASLDSSTQVTVRCTLIPPPGTQIVNYTVALSSGSSGSMAERTMRAGTATLTYNVFRNSQRTEIWGDGTGGTRTVTGTLLLTQPPPARTRQQTHTGFGRIPPAQDVAARNYADVLAVTVTF